jgi:phosphotransferase system enzyme I (PtsI)
MLKGIPASSGIAMGKAYLLDKSIPVIEKRKITDKAIETEKFDRSLKEARLQIEDIKRESEKSIGSKNSEIFNAHLLMLEDEELISTVYGKIQDEEVNVEFAVKTTIEAFVEIFQSLDSEYMRERGSDVKDIGDRLLRILLNIETVELGALKGSHIVVAKDLSPSDTANMNKDNVLGFITQIGGKTSHSAIMARTLEIPAIVGIGNEILDIKNGDMLIVDGDAGEVILNPDEATLEKYKRLDEELKAKRQELEILKNQRSVTKDGYHVELAANIGSVKDVKGV